MNEQFVPVWVDIREDPFPLAPALVRYGSEWDLLLSPSRTVCNPYYRCYLVRSYVLSPDLETLLNEPDGKPVTAIRVCREESRRQRVRCRFPEDRDE